MPAFSYLKTHSRPGPNKCHVLFTRAPVIFFPALGNRAHVSRQILSTSWLALLFFLYRSKDTGYKRLPVFHVSSALRC